MWKMCYLKVLVIFLWTTKCALTVLGDDLENKCCPDATALVAGSDFPHCWDPVTGNTTNADLQCEEAMISSRVMMSMMKLNEEGNLILAMNGEQSIFMPGKFCISNVTNKKYMNLNKSRITYAVCFEESDDKDEDGHEAVLAYCILVSVICLTATAFIYAAFPELRDLQGKSIVSFCLSLAIGLGALAVLKKFVLPTFHHCAAAVFINYYFLISSFLWMNGISIQIVANLRKPLIDKYDWKEYRWYAVYAWGTATVLTTILIIVNYTPGDHVRPGIGITSCWYNSKLQMWYYMYSVMTIMIVVNICIFVYISVILWRNTFTSTHAKAVKYKITMTVRLFVIMGLPWIFEMISSLSPEHIIWFILDILNVLQGLLMFLLLVVFRKRVIKVLYHHGWLECISGAVERWLAVSDDDEDNVMQTTEVPMHDTRRDEKS